MSVINARVCWKFWSLALFKVLAVNSRWVRLRARCPQHNTDANGIDAGLVTVIINDDCLAQSCSCALRLYFYSTVLLYSSLWLFMNTLHGFNAHLMIGNVNVLVTPRLMTSYMATYRCILLSDNDKQHWMFQDRFKEIIVSCFWTFWYFQNATNDNDMFVPCICVESSSIFISSGV